MEEFSIDGLTIKEHLLKHSYSEIVKMPYNIGPKNENRLGVSVFFINNLAARIAKDDWRRYFATIDGFYADERYLAAKVVDSIKFNNVDEYLEALALYIPLINSNSTLDVIRNCKLALRIRSKREEIWNFLIPYLYSKNAYSIRFALMYLNDKFVVFEYIDRLIKEIPNIKILNIHVSKDLGTLICTCFCMFPEETYKFMRYGDIQPDILKYAIYKCISSVNLSKDEKQVINALKDRFTRPLT